MRLRDRQKQATRDEVLVAAGALFAEQGYAQTTTRQVAERAGVGVGTVFAHFPDKAALVEALLHEHIEAALAEAFAGLPRGDVVDELVHVADVLYRAYDRTPDLSRVLLSETLFAAHPDRPLAVQLARFEAWVTSRLDAAVAAGEVPPVDPRLAFLEYFALYFALLVGGLRGALPAALRAPTLEAGLRRFFGPPREP